MLCQEEKVRIAGDNDLHPALHRSRKNLIIISATRDTRYASPVRADRTRTQGRPLGTTTWPLSFYCPGGQSGQYGGRSGSDGRITQNTSFIWKRG